MTIAACYVSPEGVVFGADSTTTLSVEGTEHHFNYGQKIFEIGEGSTLAISNWGTGSLGHTSLRTLVARLADQFVQQPLNSVNEAAWRWGNLFWSEYSAVFAKPMQRLRELRAKGDRSPDEESELVDLSVDFSCGFCLGGYVGQKRTPEAFELQFSLALDVPPTPVALHVGFPKFWGWPNLMNRLLWGVDPSLYGAILASGKWTGTDDELVQILLSKQFAHPRSLPLREAIDWVHACIYTTIKAMKFSHFKPYCGGPIEIGVISSDRRFRWVTHKGFDAAIHENLR